MHSDRWHCESCHTVWQSSCNVTTIATVSSQHQLSKPLCLYTTFCHMVCLFSAFCHIFVIFHHFTCQAWVYLVIGWLLNYWIDHLLHGFVFSINRNTHSIQDSNTVWHNGFILVIATRMGLWRSAMKCHHCFVTSHHSWPVHCISFIELQWHYTNSH